MFGPRTAGRLILGGQLRLRCRFRILIALNDNGEDVLQEIGLRFKIIACAMLIALLLALGGGFFILHSQKYLLDRLINHEIALLIQYD